MGTGCWEVPGGGVRAGESANAVKEILQEAWMFPTQTAAMFSLTSE
ncbi:MAG: NUDIX hydrolase [Ruminococcus sp.]